ncbi:hypothetical protein ACWGPT_18875 [Pseudorhizobium sp. NPDC055634]
MFPRLAMIASLALVPLVAAAETPDICRTLQRHLATLPQVIGSTSEVRRHAEALRDLDAEIRQLRTEMRRARCGRSIVTLGRQDDICTDLSGALKEAEAMRDAVAAQRSAARQILRPSPERSAVLGALQANGCHADESSDRAPVPVPVAADPAPATENRGSAKPHSSITRLSPDAERGRPTGIEPLPLAPPERPYDPSRQVRSVGPAFLPDETGIDLANPAESGARPVP